MRAQATHVLPRLPALQEHGDGRDGLLNLRQLAPQPHAALVQVLLHQPVVLVPRVQLLYHLVRGAVCGKSRAVSRLPPPGRRTDTLQRSIGKAGHSSHSPPTYAATFSMKCAGCNLITPGLSVAAVAASLVLSAGCAAMAGDRAAAAAERVVQSCGFS